MPTTNNPTPASPDEAADKLTAPSALDQLVATAALVSSTLVVGTALVCAVAILLDKPFTWEMAGVGGILTFVTIPFVVAGLASWSLRKGN